jgi:hypothetical protein
LRTLGHAKAIVALLAARKANLLEQRAALSVASELVHLADLTSDASPATAAERRPRRGARRKKRAE